MRQLKGTKLKITVTLICLGLVGLFTLSAIYTAPQSSPGEQEPSPIMAESPSQEAPSERSNGTTWFLIKSLAVMGVLFILMFALLKGSRNWFYGQGNMDDALSIHIRGSKILGAKKSLYYVEALGHILLLGVTEKEISVLLDIPMEQLSEEQQNKWRNNNHTADPGFKKMLNSIMKQGRS